LAITGNGKTERNKIMIDKILSELKTVIDHTTNKDHANRLFRCYEQLEKYRDESLPVDCRVSNANSEQEKLFGYMYEIIARGIGTLRNYRFENKEIEEFLSEMERKHFYGEKFKGKYITNQ
jgi:hypothetical protein